MYEAPVATSLPPGELVEIATGDVRVHLGQVLNATVTIAAEGRKYGIYLLLSTQRPSKIHVNALSQGGNLVLMRMKSTEDVRHLASVFSFVPESLLTRSTGFAQGESLVAGKISPVPMGVRFGHRYSHEGGSDVPDSWTFRTD